MLEKMDKDIENLVTPEKVAKFEKSDTAREVVKILGKLSADGEVEITQTVFVTIRDFLITQIILANANRSGVISNMTVGEFARGKNILHDGKYVVSVKDHKTASTHGPARVIMNGALYNWLDIYRHKLRSQLTATSDAMFLSWNGKPLASGHVSRAVRSSWKKGGLDDPVHCTLMRKSAVSEVHANHRDMAVELADLMTHRVETARKYYRLSDKKRNAVSASTKLSNILKPGQPSSNAALNDFAVRKNMKTVEQKVISSTTSSSVITFVSDEVTGLDTGYAQQPVIPEVPPLAVHEHELTSTSEPSTSSGYVFSHEENDVQLQRFGNMIKGSSPILLEEIKKKLKGYDLLKKYGAWKVQNRIKYERYKYRQRKQK